MSALLEQLRKVEDYAPWIMGSIKELTLYTSPDAVVDHTNTFITFTARDGTQSKHTLQIALQAGKATVVWTPLPLKMLLYTYEIVREKGQQRFFRKVQDDLDWYFSEERFLGLPVFERWVQIEQLKRLLVRHTNLQPIYHNVLSYLI